VRRAAAPKRSEVGPSVTDESSALRPGQPAFGQTKRKFVNNLTKILIWVAVIGVAFAIAWWKGYLLQISNYVRLTREELRKCSWPTWDELKGSTVLVAISIFLMGAFTFAVDIVFEKVVTLIAKI
jgi:preprotein translocase subunit SecE